MNPRPAVLVAGASSGIGAACAQRFLAEGWDVAALARRGERLQRLQQGQPERVLALGCDLTRTENIRAAIAQLRAWRTGLQAVVCSAGDFLVAPMEHTSSAEFERIWRLTVWGKFYLVRELLPCLAAEAEAAPRAVVHLASLAAHRDFPDETAYMSAMHGVIGLARAQDAELRSRGIRVAVVSPGLVRTELTERSFPAPALAHALPAGAMAESVFTLVRTIRDGGYIPEIFHVPGSNP